MSEQSVIALLRLQLEKYDALAKAAPASSGARRAAEETVRVTRELLAWYAAPNIQFHSGCNPRQLTIN